MKRRIVLILVIVSILAVIGGGVWWWIRRSSGTKLLARAEVALQAGNPDRAIELAKSYSAANPKDWRGPHFQGRAYIASGRYEEARQVLGQAAQLAPDEVQIPMAMADTYAHPARQVLEADAAGLQTDAILKAIEQINQAADILHKVKAPDDKAALEIASSLGLVEMELGYTYQRLSQKMSKEAEVARGAGAAEQAAVKQKAADDAKANQASHLTDAKRLFLEVVQKGAAQEKRPASCDRAADALVQLAQETRDKEMLDAARQIILPLADPPPMATALLITKGFEDADAETGAPADPKKLTEAAARLDAILQKHPEHRDALYVKLARGKIALRLNDYDTVDAICKGILDADPRQAEARMLQAAAMKTRGRHAEAEQILFALKTDATPQDNRANEERRKWAAAINFAYAQVALETGKKELAREALRTVTKLDPEHIGALVLLTGDLLASGFNDQAFSEAKVLYDKHPENPAAVGLYVRAAHATNQDNLATEALRQAEQKHRDSAAMQSAVSKGYDLLGDTARSKAAAEAAAATKPTRIDDQVARAESLLRLGRTAEAEAALDAMVASHPELALAHYMRGQLYEKTGRTMQAVDEYQTAIGLDPQNLGYRLARARALLNAQLVDEAEAEVKAVLARDPANADAAELARDIRISRGETLGDGEFQQVVAAGKQRGLPLALAYLNRGEPDKCIDVCGALRKEKPDDPDLRWVLGQAYLVKGDSGKCVEQWRALIEAAPNDWRAYLALGKVYARTKRPKEVEAELTGIPGARRELVTAAMASLYQQTRQFDLAAEAYGRFAGDAAAPEGMRNSARLERAQCLALAGHMDQALKQLDTLAGQKAWNERAVLAKASILAGARRTAEARALLEQLRQAANTDRNPSLLARVGLFYLQLQLPEETAKIADELEKLQPKEPEPCLLRAAAFGAQKNRAKAIECYRDAVARQPANFANHVTLIRALDADGQFPEALEALKALESHGETGQMLATAERATVFRRWGLQKQAVDCIAELAKEETAKSPSIRLSLGQAFARLGREAEARQELEKIPAYAPQHVAAQQTLADLAGTDDERLAILRKLDADRPNPMLTAQRMGILFRTDRNAEAVKEFETFTAASPPNTPVPEGLATGALQAYLRTGDLDKAARLAVQVATLTNRPVWKRAAALLTMDSHPETAKAMLPPALTADAFNAMLGLCLAVQQGADAKVWVDRLDQIGRDLAQATPPTALPGRFRVLVHIITGAAGEAEKEVAGIIGEDLLGKSVIGEFVSSAKDSPDAVKEATALLKASVAAEVGLPDLAHLWTMKLLEARPEFQWAASVAGLHAPSSKGLRQVLAILKPADCILARMIQASLLKEEGEFAKAAEIYAQIVAVEKKTRRLLLNQAIALEGAGQLAEALPLYRRVWEEEGNVTAANNAAYLVTELHPQDKAKLTEAGQWLDQAIAKKDTPNLPAFRDTKGWIQHLLGQNDEALAELRIAVRGMPDSPEVHYHLGIVEKACGHKEYARWHLQAAVDLGEGLKKATKGKLPKATADAIERARETLKELNGA